MLANDPKGYVVAKPIDKIVPIEAMVLVNRWAKLKDEFYYDDRDALYDLKDRKIAEMVRNGKAIATKVITRETDAMKGMKAAFANGGNDLELMDYLSIYEYLKEEEEEHFRLLNALVDREGIEVEYPEDIYQMWMSRLQPEIDAYSIAKAAYDAELKARQPSLNQYQKDLQAWQLARQEVAFAWAKENGIKIARSNSGKSLKKNWLSKLEKQGFRYDIAPPPYPFSSKLTCPKEPKIPAKTYTIESFKEYVPGSIAVVESAIEWAKQKYGDGFPSEYYKIDDSFICCDFEKVILEGELDNMREYALEIFQQVVDGKITDPHTIWDRLTDLGLDYESAIGMRCFRDRRNWGQVAHAEYGTWHEINLSPTGYWLVEFQSIEIPEITFHVPYKRVLDLKMPVHLNSLPQIEDDSKMGREISPEEREAYPLGKVIEILGVSVGDFPYQLRRYYRRAQFRHFDYMDDDDDDWDNDWDEEE